MLADGPLLLILMHEVGALLQEGTVWRLEHVIDDFENATRQGDDRLLASKAAGEPAELSLQIAGAFHAGGLGGFHQDGA